MNDVLDSGNEQKIVEGRRRRLAERERSDFLKVVSSPEGRRFVRRLMKVSGRIDGAATPVDGDQLMTYYRLGRWQMGDALRLLLEKECPEQLALMEREFKNDQLQAEAEKKVQGESNGE